MGYGICFLFCFLFLVNAFNSKYLCGHNEALRVLQALRELEGWLSLIQGII